MAQSIPDIPKFSLENRTDVVLKETKKSMNASATVIEKASEPRLLDVENLTEDDEVPEGGRGWLVVLGCFIVAAVIMGWP